jgi:hypothetical protein
LIARHDLRRWLGAREATLSEDGVVRFEGETDTAKVQGVTGLRPGPVLVRGDAAAKPFREMATVPTALLRAGTLETLRASVALAEAGRYVLAATVAAWSAAPLILALASLTAR